MKKALAVLTLISAVTLTGTDNTRYHAYAVARQGISHQLKFRADQIRKATTNGR